MTEKEVKELAEIIINLDKYDIEECMKEYKRQYPEEYKQLLKEERELVKKA